MVKAPNLSKNRYAFAPVICGSASIVLGLMVLVGWYANNTLLIQVLPQFAPMQYNTALGFLLCGLGLVALARKNSIIAILCGLIVCLIGGLTLTQYVLDLDFGIDQLLMEYDVMVKTSHPGRMAPNTALCFSIFGAALLLGRRDQSILISLSIAVFILSALALVGYLSVGDGIYGWDTLTRMAIHTASGFCVLSLGLLTFALTGFSLIKFDFWKVSPLAACLVVIILTLFSWHSITEATNAQTEEYFQTLTHDTQSALENRFKLYEQNISFGGLGVIYASENVNRQEWVTYVEALDVTAKLPGINGIGYIDAVEEQDLPAYLDVTRADGIDTFINHPVTDYPDKFIIKYIEPRILNEAAIGLDIGFERNRREAAEYARDHGTPTLTKKIELVQDQKKKAGFLLLIPAYDTKIPPTTQDARRAHFSGWVYAPFIGENFIQGLPDIARGKIGFHIYDGNNVDADAVIYSSHPDQIGQDVSAAHKAQTSIILAERIWTIEWFSTNHFKTHDIQNTSVVVLIFGLILAALLYFTLDRLVRSKNIVKRQVERRTAELAAAQDFQNLITSTIPDLIFVKDNEFRIVEANPAFINLYPKDKQNKIIGYSSVEDYDEEEAKEFLKYDQQAFDEGFSETEEEIKFPNGEIRILSTKKVRFYNSINERFILGIARDITEKKKNLDDLIRSNQELDDFAYIASHDLKEPLRGIHNHIKLLQEDYADKLDEDANHKIDRVMYLTQRMEKLISDLLYYSRLGRGDYAWEMTDLNEVVTDVEEMLVDKENIHIDIDGTLPAIVCDPLRVTELFRNLITNAVKYNDCEEKHIKVGVKDGTIKGRKKDIVFYIKDNGIGIDEKFHDDIFKIFKRLHKKEAYGGGTGSGLTFVKKIIDQHNGNIWVESALGNGTAFYFTLPGKG